MSEHQFREDGSHYNGGAEFFGYGFSAINEPRLKMIRRWYRQGVRRGKSEDRFFVDGEHVADYAAALEALKSPAILSADERSKLELFSKLDEPFDIRGGGEAESRLNYALRSKGLIRAHMGKAYLTPAGRAALSKDEGGES